MTRPMIPHSLLLAAVLASTGCDAVKDALPWQRFSIASTSMEPTLPKGSHITGETVDVASLRRGDIVILHEGDINYVMRLAGLPGDRIALVDGVVVLNGKAVTQRLVGTWTITEQLRSGAAAMLSERFPGERRVHRILDNGITPGDNFAEVELGSDTYFVLGDNRDNSADSRYAAPFGRGVVNGRAIVRRIDPGET